MLAGNKGPGGVYYRICKRTMVHVVCGDNDTAVKFVDRSESYYSPAERFFYSGDDPSVHTQEHDDDDDDNKSVEQNSVLNDDLPTPPAVPALIDTAAVRRKWRPYAVGHGGGMTMNNGNDNEGPCNDNKAARRAQQRRSLKVTRASNVNAFVIFLKALFGVGMLSNPAVLGEVGLLVGTLCHLLIVIECAFACYLLLSARQAAKAEVMMILTTDNGNLRHNACITSCKNETPNNDDAQIMRMIIKDTPMRMMTISTNNRQ